jgi:hypothetical protein
MNKAKVIGLAVTGLAVVGGLAIFSYYRKPKATRGKFLSMDGENFYDVEQSDFSNMDRDNFYNEIGGSTNSGYHCETRNPDGSTTITNSMGDCPKGSRMVKNTTRRTSYSI